MEPKWLNEFEYETVWNGETVRVDIRKLTPLLIPIRLDATLCDPNEIFLEDLKDGTVRKVWPLD